MSARLSRKACREKEQRDQAVDFALEHLHLWSEWPRFLQFLVARTLRRDVRPSAAKSLADLRDDEENLVGSLLTLLVSVGAFPRTTIATELPRLTTRQFPLGGAWIELDAFKPRMASPPTHNLQHTSRRPVRRRLKLRFPLPLLVQALLNRVLLFYRACAKQGHCLRNNPPPVLSARESDQALFSEYIRTKKGFLLKWLRQAYREFKKQVSLPHQKGAPFPALPAHQFTWKAFVAASQMRLLEELPPWVVAALRQRWKSRPSTRWDIERIFLDKDTPTEEWGWTDEFMESTDTQHPLTHEDESWHSGGFLNSFPSELEQAQKDVAKLIRALHPDSTFDTRKTIAGQIRRIRLNLWITETPRAKSRGAIENSCHVLNWLEWLLGRKGLSPATVQKYFEGMLVLTFLLFEGIPLRSFTDSDEIIDGIAECMRWSDNPSTQRAIKDQLRSFLKWMHRQHGFPELNWRDPELWVYHDATERPVFTFHDIDHLLNHITHVGDTGRYSPTHVARLRVFVILCFYAGLRRREATRLTLADWDDGPESLLWVRRSKTRHGKRILPLHMLIPEAYLQEIRNQYQYAMETMRQERSLHEVPLLPDDQGQFCLPSDYGQEVARLMKEALHAGSAHALRHSFCTFALIRWDLAIHGKPDALPATEFAHPIFSESMLEKYCTFITGRPSSEWKAGTRALTRPLSVLMSAIGHACPEITLSIYSHALDWVYYLHLLRRQPQLTFLGISHELTVAECNNLLLRSDKTFNHAHMPSVRSLDQVIQWQRERLGHQDRVV